MVDDVETRFGMARLWWTRASSPPWSRGARTRAWAHAADHGHHHTHGVVDPVIATTARGIWAVKWSFVILGVTAALQLGIVMLSGSVALLADTIHNVGDAATAVPLWIAFLFARRRASARFPTASAAWKTWRASSSS